MKLRTLMSVIGKYHKFELCEEKTWNVNGVELTGDVPLTDYRDMVGEFREKHLKKYGNRDVKVVRPYGGDGYGLCVVIKGV